VDWEREAGRLAAGSLAEGSPTAWFDRLYRGAVAGAVSMPWDRDAPSPPLAAWAPERVRAGDRAAVVGCGLGADAEFLARLGADVLAFDVSPTAVGLAAARHPGTRVTYRQGDLFALPAEWVGAFDLVVDVFTVQALPEGVRPEATAAVAALVAPGGTLLVVTVLREGPMDRADGPPWPLTRAQLDAFASDGLRPGPAARVDGARELWRAEFHRPSHDRRRRSRATWNAGSEGGDRRTALSRPRRRAGGAPPR
jgi:SAM-dependent methyltransferase